MLRGVRGSEAFTQLQDRRRLCRGQPIAERITYHSSLRLMAVRGARLGDAAVGRGHSGECRPAVTPLRFLALSMRKYFRAYSPSIDGNGSLQTLQ